MEERREDFKERLAAARRSKGLSQQDLAQMVGVSVDTFRRWEWGKGEPRLSEFVRLAEILEITIEELATGAPPGGMITIRRGDMSVDIPATLEGFVFLEEKMKELYKEQDRSIG